MDLMLQRIYKQAAFILIPVAIVSVFFTGWRFSLSMLIGGLIGIVNLKGLAWSVKGLLGTEKAQGKMMALSIFKLLFIFSILIILAVLGVLKAYGLLIGFTVFFVLMLREGLLFSKKEE